MSHVVRSKLDTDTAPSDAADRVESWQSQFRPILPDTHREYQTRTDITDEPLYDTFQARFDVRDDLSAIVDELVTAFETDVEWMQIETQQDDREWQHEEYADDPDYYPLGTADGHRIPPALNRAGLFEVGAAEAAYLIDGNEHSAPATTIVPDAPAEEPRTDMVVAGTAGKTERLEATTASDVPEDVVIVGELEVHPGKVVVIEVADVDVETTDWSVAAEIGTVPDDI